MAKKNNEEPPKEFKKKPKHKKMEPYNRKKAWEIDNNCPTLDNHINCSECTHECKLRMQPKNSKEVEVPPEPLLNTIYY